MIAAQRLAREADEVMGDDAHAERRIELTAAQRAPRRAPELPPVVGQDLAAAAQARMPHRYGFAMIAGIARLLPGRNRLYTGRNREPLGARFGYGSKNRAA